MKRILFVALMVVLIWQTLVLILRIPNYFLPAPLEVARVIHHQGNLLVFSSVITLVEACLGFFLALFLGSLAAFVFFHYQKLGYLFWPVLVMSQALPTLAIAPLLILWLGYGLFSKIILVTLFLFFPITSAFLDGLNQVNPLWIAEAELMTKNKRAIFWRIRLPAALPHLASGVRIASAGALMGAVIGEWVGASQGLGFVLLEANARFQTSLVFATILLLVLLSLMFFSFVDSLLNALITW